MLSKFLCWLGFHDWGCMYHHQWDHSRTGLGTSEITGWKCHRCPKEKTEQWDG